MGERVDHLADDAPASVTVEGWVERVEQPMMGLAAVLPAASGLLVVRDVVGDDRTAVVLRARKDLIVADPGVVPCVRWLADRDHVESALAQLERDRRRPHLV